MKIRQVAAEFFHADGQTDKQTNVTKVLVDFGNFAKAPKCINSNWYQILFPESKCQSRKAYVAQLKVLWNPKTYSSVDKNPRTGAVLSQIKRQTLYFSRWASQYYKSNIIYINVDLRRIADFSCPPSPPPNPPHQFTTTQKRSVLLAVALRYAEAGNTVRAINKVCILDLSSIQV